mgnify:CR=1 FL=1
MTNGEKYKNVIKRLTSRYPSLHPAVINGKVVPCAGSACHDCDLYNKPPYNGCSDTYRDWLKSEVAPDEQTPEKKDEKMKKDEIKIGDTVKVTMKSHMKEGATGTVRMIRRTEAGIKLYGVDFDGDDTGYALLEYEIEKVKSKKTPPRIVIYQNGDTVTARDLETGEEESAVCSKDDTFDFYTGSFIALSRLTGHAYMLPVMMGDIELMERDLADFKNRVKAMMGDGDMWPCDDFFNEKGKK